MRLLLKSKYTFIGCALIFYFISASVRAGYSEPERTDATDNSDVVFGIQPVVSPDTQYESNFPHSEIAVVFNIHSENDLGALVNLLDQLRKEKSYSTIIWVLEDALLFGDLIPKMVTGEIDIYSKEMGEILERRLREDPRKRLKEINELRTPINDKRTNYIPNLNLTPRIDYLLRNPTIGLALESINSDLTVEHARSVLLAAAYKWKAFLALINGENEELFFSYMVKSTRHYLKSAINERDKILAKKLHRLIGQYPHALIFMDRGIDHMDSLLRYLNNRDFKGVSITYYYPAAYRAKSFSLRNFEKAASRLSEKESSNIKDPTLMNDFKRFTLGEILFGSLGYHFPRESSVTINNAAFSIIERMSDNAINHMLKVIQTKNKTMTDDEKQAASGSKVLKWFIQNNFISSKSEIQKQLAQQPSGYIKKEKVRKTNK